MSDDSMATETATTAPLPPTLWEAASAVLLTKGQAVAEAVSDQLDTDGRPNNNFDAVMGADLLYSNITINSFMIGIHARLLRDTPAFAFNPDPTFGASCLTKTVAETTGAIYAATT